jgi:hypothetical protein
LTGVPALATKPYYEGEDIVGKRRTHMEGPKKLQTKKDRNEALLKSDERIAQHAQVTKTLTALTEYMCNCTAKKVSCWG